MYILTSFSAVCLIILFHRNIDYCSHLSVLAAIELIDFVSEATYLHKWEVYGASACNVRSNVSLRLLEKFSMGDPGTFWLISPLLHRLETSNFFKS